MIRSQFYKESFLIAAVVASCLTSSVVFADDAGTALILKKIEAMENEIKTLKAQVKKGEETKPQMVPVKSVASTTTVAEEKAELQPTSVKTKPSTLSLPAYQNTKTLNEDLDPGLFGMTYRSTDALRFGAYGEIKFGRQESGDNWKNGFDAGRVVLLGTYPISDDIAFNTELEFEHGGLAKDEDDKLGGSVDVEQVFIDFKFNDYFNCRAPGVDIVPVGYVGLFHEPTQFYSVDRPELYNGLIPSTWFEGATSAYGKIIDNVTYQFQINTGLEDAGIIAPDSDSTVPQGGYDPGISGTESLGLARASISDRKQLGNNLGYALRVAYNPPVVPGLAGSTSFYMTPDTSPRGAYGTNADDSTFLLGKSSLEMFDTELRYRVPRTGLELRGEFVDVEFGDPKNLRANNDGDPEDNVGDRMYGHSFEAAYHFYLNGGDDKGWEFVPFYRYTKQTFQSGGFAGHDENDPTGAGRQRFHTFGFALFPTPKLVLKLDYQRALDDADDSPKADHFFGGVGFFF